MQYVYMLRAGTNHYKIGVAINIRKRVSAIQTGNPKLIEVVTTKIVTNAYEAERLLHTQLTEMKTNGGTEWFALKPAEALEMAVAINRLPGVEIDDKINVTQILYNQKQLEKLLAKKLDYIINTYQKKRKPLPEPQLAKHTPEQLSFDETVEKAKNIVLAKGQASTSMLQRHMSIGYGKAARIIDNLEKQGIIGALDGSKPRKLII